MFVRLPGTGGASHHCHASASFCSRSHTEVLFNVPSPAGLVVIRPRFEQDPSFQPPGRRFSGRLFSLIVAGSSSAHAHAATRHHAAVPHWLIQLGLPGLCVISLLDASPIPLPLPGSADLLLLLLCAQPRSQPLLLAVATTITSVAGGYLTWRAGQKGGEKLVSTYTKGRAARRLIKKLRGWVGHHGGATVAVSAALPPPVPLMPLLLGASALGVSRRQFLLAFSGARAVRYGFVAWVGATYGKRVLRAWNLYLADWTAPILWTFVGLLVAAIGFGLWQFRRMKVAMGEA